MVIDRVPGTPTVPFSGDTVKPRRACSDRVPGFPGVCKGNPTVSHRVPPCPGHGRVHRVPRVPPLVGGTRSRTRSVRDTHESYEQSKGPLP